MKRSAFIKSGSLAMLAGILMPKFTFANLIPSKNIGLQLYSLRDEMAKDPGACLEKIADIGYTQLEAAGYKDGLFYGMKPSDFKSLIEDLGMKLISSHVTFTNDSIGIVLEAHRNAGIQYLVWPWLNQDQRASIEEYKNVAEKFNTIGKMCKDNGIRFGYHNHDFEFHEMDGVVPYDLLLDETDPDLVCMEIDLYWIAYAGRDPVEYFKKYPGRFELWHVKDMAGNENKEMTEVGNGIIDYTHLFEHSSASGMKEFFIEQDTIKGDGFESVKTSYDYINSIL